MTTPIDQLRDALNAAIQSLVLPPGVIVTMDEENWSFGQYEFSVFLTDESKLNES